MMLDPSDNNTFGIDPKDGWYAPDETEGLETGLFLSEEHCELAGVPFTKESIAIYNDSRFVVEHCDGGIYNFEYPDDRDELETAVTELMNDE